MSIEIKKGLQDIIPYTPGKSKDEIERELGIRDAAKLASNENPIGASPEAVKAVSETINEINQYPDGTGKALKEAISKKIDVAPSQVIIGNGSNEVIELIVRAFMNPGEEAIISDLTFSLYRTFVLVGDGIPVIVPLKEFRHDLNSMRSKVGKKTRFIFLSNPNNPTGTILRHKEVIDFIRDLSSDIIIIFDEAYREYVTDRSFPDTIDYINKWRNIIVLRTFSKIYGLAGLRIGYGIGNEEYISCMNKVRQPFNVNSLAQKAGRAAISDNRHLARSIDVNNKGKRYLYRAFEEIGIEYIPTEANFIYFDCGRDGRKVYNLLLKEGVIIRYIKERKLRVSIGLPEENKRFIDALKKVLHYRE
ncbi:MAG: histidinol-phosphate transaminase [Nitrospirota bacterium]